MSWHYKATYFRHAESARTMSVLTWHCPPPTSTLTLCSSRRLLGSGVIAAWKTRQGRSLLHRSNDKDRQFPQSPLKSCAIASYLWVVLGPLCRPHQNVHDLLHIEALGRPRCVAFHNSPTTLGDCVCVPCLMPRKFSISNMLLVRSPYCQSKRE